MALPWPGKCLIAVITPRLWCSSMTHRAFSATTVAFSENLRLSLPMAGESGLTARSTTGPKFRLNPFSPTIAASARPASRVAVSFSCAPSDRAETVGGNPEDSFRRQTAPPSWSTATKIGIAPA